jgi:hypothetical protein
MKLDELIQIKSEIKRFSDTIDEAIMLAKATPGWTSSRDQIVYGKHDISGTRMSGTVKRRALDLKQFLTKELNH